MVDGGGEKAGPEHAGMRRSVLALSQLATGWTDATQATIERIAESRQNWVLSFITQLFGQGEFYMGNSNLPLMQNLTSSFLVLIVVLVKIKDH